MEGPTQPDRVSGVHWVAGLGGEEMRTRRGRYLLSVVSIAVFGVIGLGAVALAAGPFESVFSSKHEPWSFPQVNAFAVVVLMAALAVREVRAVVRHASTPLGSILRRRRVLFVGVNRK